MLVNVRQYFTPKSIAQKLSTLPKLESPVMDTFFPEARRRQWPLAVIGLDHIAKVTRAVPVIRRGSPAIPMGQGARAWEWIEPQPVEVSDFFSAVDLNNWKLLDDVSKDMVITEKINDMRTVVRNTTEGLCAQALTGTITWPMRLQDGTTDTYTVDFTNGGANPLLTYVVGTAWNDNAKTLVSIMDDLIRLEDLFSDQGYGNPEFWCGRDVYLAAFALAQAANSGKNSPINVQINDRSISIGGYTLKLALGSYYNPALAAQGVAPTLRVVADKQILAFARNAPFTLYYTALDDMYANLLPMPFYARPVEQEDPQGIKVIGKSKPLPVPVPKALCWVQAIP